MAKFNAAALPAWASHKGENRHGMPIIVVDTHAAYPALLEEYRELYADRDGLPSEFRTADGEVRKEWTEALDDLDSDEPSAYWMEVLYQSAKLEIVRAVGFGTENRFNDPGKRFAQRGRAKGRGPEKAAGGLQGGREAREHYKRLRGFLPV